jgi:hypothetical protein
MLFIELFHRSPNKPPRRNKAKVEHYTIGENASRPALVAHGASAILCPEVRSLAAC